MSNRRRTDRLSLGQQLFAPRQVYVRSGMASQFVILSRGLQITVAAGCAAVVLGLGLASWTAVAKHLETVQQSRELARLENVAQSMRSTVEQTQRPQQPEAGAVAHADLVSQIAALKAEREQALTAAKTAADEAAALRGEVRLAHERVAQLRRALVEAAVRGWTPADGSAAGGPHSEAAAQPR